MLSFHLEDPATGARRHFEPQPRLWVTDAILRADGGETLALFQGGLWLTRQGSFAVLAVDSAVRVVFQGEDAPQAHGPFERVLVVGGVLALELGAASAGPADADPPEPLDSAVLFAPAGELVPVAMRALDQGGTLAVAGIHLSDIPALHYADELFREKQLRSVTANTRADGEEFLRLVERLRIRPTVTPRPLAEADRALADLAADRITGAAVLVP